jgi:hypothetical protein
MRVDYKKKHHMQPEVKERKSRWDDGWTRTTALDIFANLDTKLIYPRHFYVISVWSSYFIMLFGKYKIEVLLDKPYNS